MSARYWLDWGQQEIRKRVGHMDQLAGIRVLRLAEGKGAESRHFLVWTGSGLLFEVAAERALDITSCRYRGIPLAWLSPVAMTHPSYYEPEGAGWLRSFSGGFLTTCGLDQFGAPCTENEERFGLHGRISNLPVEHACVRRQWAQQGYELEIVGEVRQASVFGENLVLQRRIVTRWGSSAVRIEDVVSNEGFSAQPHMILYHFNLGFPLISEDAELDFKVEETVPRDETSRAGIDSWKGLQTPTHGYEEQVFRHRPVADEDGLVRVGVVNPRVGLAVRWAYRKQDLPFLYQWKMMGEGTYVLGVEPANCGTLAGRAAAREGGELPVLHPGEKRTYELQFEVLELPSEGDEEAGSTAL